MSTTEESETVAGEPVRAPAKSFRLAFKIGLSLSLSVASVIAFLGLWTIATELGWVAPVFLPSPRAVLAEAGKIIRNGELWTAVLMSSQRVFAGFALAALVAIPLGIVMAVWWPAKAFSIRSFRCCGRCRPSPGFR